MKAFSAHRLALLVPIGVGLAYALGHLGWYLGTPLGQVPVLDERENLQMAEAIVHGSLPQEPFYRAPGYALVLALIRCLGVGAKGLFPASLLFGAFLHAVGAGLAAALSRRWFGSRAGLVAGILYALNPVLVEQAVHTLDGSLGVALFLFGVYALTSALETRAAGSWLLASTAFGLATEVRPNYLLLLLGVPVTAILTGQNARARAACVAGFGVILAAVLWQASVGGGFTLLPWQGPYNAWAANRPGANGRYFAQQVALAGVQGPVNPARVESMVLYQKETGLPSLTADGKPQVAAMGRYWRSKLVEEVTHHPVRWMALMGRKAYALVNNWEQYNNTTYAFHKARSPWLRPNPLCWAIVWVLALAGWARAWTTRRHVAWIALGVGLVSGLSILLFFVSARFRLPLVALGCVLGGALAGPSGVRTAWSRPARVAIGAGLAAAFALSVSTWGGVADTGTFVQDHVLLARAALETGDFGLALDEARDALAMRPDHPDALRIRQEAAAALARP